MAGTKKVGLNRNRENAPGNPVNIKEVIMAKDRAMTVASSHCGIHPGYTICVKVDGTPWELDAIEGAFIGYLNATNCAVCAAEALGLSMDSYIGIFVEQFLPLISNAKSLEASGYQTVDAGNLRQRLSYG